ncbi:MAG: polynucleotide adenylyltransferase PcnB [Deltaproteobacteria bacterium]|nr:polynucleotide adenylyltransferase PcnB [Deltaproteobacteria bacterium]
MTRVIDSDFGRREDEDRRVLSEEPPEPLVYAYAIPRRLVDQDAAKVIRRLNRHGHTAYLVGGGVRDLMLGRKPKDFDLATSARPYEVRDLFRNCRVIGRRFRLAHVLFSGGKIIEVATYRRDPSQHFEVIKPKIAKKIPLCAGPEPVRFRRDFTINGLFYDLERGEVIDFVGGVADLEEHLLRTIGDPNVRFREDPVRILRAIKFSARLDMGLDPEVYDAMVRHRGDLRRAAAPRVLEEILRFLRGGAAHRSVFLSWDVGVLSEILPEVASFLDDDPEGAALTFGRLKAVDALAAEDRLPGDAVLLAALLLGPIDEALEGVSDVPVAYEEFIRELSLRLSLPRRLKDRIRLLVMAQRRLRTGRIQSIARREYFGDAATLFALDRMARGEELPVWAHEPNEAVYDAEPRSRRRRRRRRPRT